MKLVVKAFVLYKATLVVCVEMNNNNNDETDKILSCRVCMMGIITVAHVVLPAKSVQTHTAQPDRQTRWEYLWMYIRKILLCGGRKGLLCQTEMDYSCLLEEISQVR